MPRHIVILYNHMAKPVRIMYVTIIFQCSLGITRNPCRRISSIFGIFEGNFKYIGISRIHVSYVEVTATQLFGKSFQIGPQLYMLMSGGETIKRIGLKFSCQTSPKLVSFGSL